MEQAYHKGELEIQEKFGELASANRAGRLINNSIISGAVPFIENQNSVILSSLDAKGNVWISFLFGDVGFIKVNNLSHLSFNRERITTTNLDVFYSNIKNTHNVGGLFIEFVSRRRYRVNGLITLNTSSLELSIEEAYPNCPKYIQRRLPIALVKQEKPKVLIDLGNELLEEHKKWISYSDTLFVGTIGNNNKLDASHRGGKPGFIEVLDNDTLKIPDYKGNKMYNTLGNISQNKNTGLLFIDFDNKRMLQLTGEAELLFDQFKEEDTLKTTGTGRYWLFKTKQWIQTDNENQTNWEFLDASPLNP